MLLTLTTTHRPATDLGYLLHKNPTKLQTFELAFGKSPHANDADPSPPTANLPSKYAHSSRSPRDRRRYQLLVFHQIPPQ